MAVAVAVGLDVTVAVTVAVTVDVVVAVAVAVMVVAVGGAACLRREGRKKWAVGVRVEAGWVSEWVGRAMVARMRRMKGAMMAAKCILERWFVV